ncbi:MAG: PAS domain-containing sensor histidine kinase [Alphaproteobacteria bacterium]|jgi:two-component system nitrogen regulation sensor histidine kinase NtrY|nr:PAS domain-containing sensor histidine kinase [Alphaproteobacteria bacterium]MDP6659959.1 PAS domain-containing sensor histidine kinase [Alphaproteobacteria bacterium]MDP6780135.1 PAS domain-containing sensor histidine kinase [Alphaproteobacteria bacterium]MDP7044561.1 PAS domain-containing sensor histidine kinase [Alphaproteobacteria bacterium]
MMADSPVTEGLNGRARFDFSDSNSWARYRRIRRRLRRWSIHVGLARKFAIGLTACTVISGIATYAALTGMASMGANSRTVLILLTIDLILLLALSVVVIRRVVKVWVARKKGSAGSRLHVQLVALFGLVAITPAIVVAVFSLLFFGLGIESWFSDRVRTALEGANVVAESYLKEHQENIRNAIVAMADDINSEGAVLYANPTALNQTLITQTTLRSLTEAVVFVGRGRVLAKSGSSLVLDFEMVPDWAIEAARDGRISILTSERGDRVRALIRLDEVWDTFLYIGRYVDHNVLQHLEQTQRAVTAYKQLEGRRSGIQITFAMVFVVVGLMLLFSAVWVGLLFANRLARPISQMIAAAEKVRAGDLSARVDEKAGHDEIDTLGRAFNRMTSQLEGQRSELMGANRQLELRRRFTETVLAGVSAGVIGLDDKGCVNLPNRSASELLATDLEPFIGKSLKEAVPEMTRLLNQVMERPGRLAQGQIKLIRQGSSRTLLVRIAAESGADKALGFVVTFDDVSDLLSAQRKAAWADVARRIAHEIKNPLTPIQLSAERLKRKYLKQITKDPEAFTTCTETIIRQVGDIGRMVDEFSSFARMPQPVMERYDLLELCRQSIFLQKTAFPSIEFSFQCDAETLEMNMDSRLMGQALTNLLKNAAESIESKAKDGGGKNKKGGQKKDTPLGQVEVSVAPSDCRAEIIIEDDGYGFPEQSRETLTEPYVTTREKGTGLGLAIVKKIMEDHQGTLILEDRSKGGARVRLILPLGGEVLPVGGNGSKFENHADAPDAHSSSSAASLYGK